MKRKFTKVTVIVISILLAELLQDLIQHNLLHWVKESKFGMYTSVWIIMAAALALFYPAFRLIEKFVEMASEKYVAGSKKLSKNSSLGLLIGLVIAIFLIFVAYCEVLYGRNPVSDFYHGLH